MWLCCVLASTAGASETPQPADDAAKGAAAVPETVVTDTGTDDDPVGKYGQPEWTTRRRFPTTRVYVAPAGQVAFEYWLEVKTPLADGAASRVRSLFEASIGLGKRLQLDLYLRTESKAGGPLELESERLELRWALADWGVIPGNPTLYLEWIRPHQGPWKAEGKLLFGGAFAPSWHWGANLSWERELWGTESNEYAVTAAFSHTLSDRKLSLGAEARVELVDGKPRYGAFTTIEFLLGPSVRWFPHPRVGVSVVFLAGAEAERDTGADPLGAFEVVLQPTLVLGANL